MKENYYFGLITDMLMITFKALFALYEWYLIVTQILGVNVISNCIEIMIYMLLFIGLVTEMITTCSNYPDED